MKLRWGTSAKIKSLADLPSDKILIEYIREAARLNEEGVKVVRKPKVTVRKNLVIPPLFKKALAKGKQAQMTFDEFSYTNKKEYIDWIIEAKTEATRDKRITTAIEWLEEGKVRNWKYAR